MKTYRTQIKIILSIFGTSFNPRKFTEYIGIRPTAFWNKGDEIPPIQGLIGKRDGDVPLRKESAWEYSIGYKQTLYFEEVSKILLKKFKDKIPMIKDFVNKGKLDAKIDVVIKIADDQVPALFFNKNFLKMANQLGATIDVDMYLLTSEE